MTLFGEFRRPFNALTMSIALISIAMSVYFYSNPHRDRGISFQKSDDSRIYNSQSSTPKLRLIDESDAVVAQDVFVTAFVFWNSGSEAIEPSEVRKPLKIIFDTPARILEVSIVKETDPAVSRFRVNADLAPGLAAKREIHLTWDHFDPRQGVKLQVIFASDRLPSLLVEGAILGVDRVRDIKSFSPIEVYLSFGLPALAAISFSTWVFVRSSRSGRKIAWDDAFFFTVLIVLVAIFLMIGSLKIIQLLRPAAPL